MSDTTAAAAELREHLHEMETLLDESIRVYRDTLQYESADLATARLASVLVQRDNATTVAVVLAVAVARLAAPAPAAVERWCPYEYVSCERAWEGKTT
jgi:hypothetical protein